MALSVPLSRFTSRVGGGSAFYVRPLTHAYENIQPQDCSPDFLHARRARWRAACVAAFDSRHMADFAVVDCQCTGISGSFLFEFSHTDQQILDNLLDDWCRLV